MNMGLSYAIFWMQCFEFAEHEGCVKCCVFVNVYVWFLKNADVFVKMRVFWKLFDYSKVVGYVIYQG
jgi:hypothetical protein